jgi:hypothetical protein
MFTLRRILFGAIVIFSSLTTINAQTEEYPQTEWIVPPWPNYNLTMYEGSTYNIAWDSGMDQAFTKYTNLDPGNASLWLGSVNNLFAHFIASMSHATPTPLL